MITARGDMLDDPVKEVDCCLVDASKGVDGNGNDAVSRYVIPTSVVRQLFRGAIVDGLAGVKEMSLVRFGLSDNKVEDIRCSVHGDTDVTTASCLPLLILVRPRGWRDIIGTFRVARCGDVGLVLHLDGPCLVCAEDAFELTGDSGVSLVARTLRRTAEAAEDMVPTGSEDPRVLSFPGTTLEGAALSIDRRASVAVREYRQGKTESGCEGVADFCVGKTRRWVGSVRSDPCTCGWAAC